MSEERKVRVEISRDSGFCFGVVYAIGLAESLLQQEKGDGRKKKKELYVLGDLVHNDKEMERLKRMGLKVIYHDELPRLKNARVLIRAHGEPGKTYEIAYRNNLELIDASCPIVLKIQNRIREAVERAEPDAQFVIYGKPTHPEVIGLSSQVPSCFSCIIVQSEEDLERIDFTRPIYVFSQTTKNIHKYYEIAECIRERARQQQNERVYVYDTICRQVSNREDRLREFARSHDVVLFVAGKKSSNGRVLFGICREENPRTFLISEPEEIQPWWLKDAQSVGICGATSTPWWLLEQVRDHVLQMIQEGEGGMPSGADLAPG